MTALAVGASPRALVPGDPDDLEALARRMDVLAGGAEGAARGLRSAGASGWVGTAGDAFRAAVDDLPAALGTAGASFAAASGALREYARVLRAAQADAARAVRLHEEAVAETRRWQAQVRA